MPTALVDLDGTLLEGSSERSFLLHLLSRGIVPPSGAAAFALRLLAHPARVLAEGAGWNRGYLAGLEEERLGREAEEFARTRLVPRLRRMVLDEIRRIGAEGTPAVLLTASLEWLAVPLAGEAGIVTVLASRPESREGLLTGRVPLRPWGRDKLTALAAAGLDPARCVAYGDSWSDRHLMTACADAVAVNPGRRLRRLAGGRGWRILEEA